MPVMISVFIHENEVRGRVISKNGCDSCSLHVLAQMGVKGSLKVIALLPHDRGGQDKFWHALTLGEAGWKAGLVTKLAQARAEIPTWSPCSRRQLHSASNDCSIKRFEQ